jgi:1,4-alpha-glucan branching enzyme
MLGRMPGDEWQRFANLRAYYGMMYGHPGKKLMFMGCEFAQSAEWSHERSLDWHQLDHEPHRGVQRLIRDLNHLYRSLPALHERDCDPDGFQWLVADDVSQSVFAWLRRGEADDSFCIMVANFTPEVRRGYRINVPMSGRWREVLNTDSAYYGGSNIGNGLGLLAEPVESGHQIVLDLPPLSTLLLVPDR